MLESLAGMYTLVAGEGNGWRERGFKKAAAVLRGLDTEITDVDQLRSIKKSNPSRMRGIGESALALLDEFYSEGKMDRFEGLSSDPRLACLRAFG
ncbi:unnamed protein product, partial [Laminaria digitata]